MGIKGFENKHNGFWQEQSSRDMIKCGSAGRLLVVFLVPSININCHYLWKYKDYYWSSSKRPGRDFQISVS